MNAIYSQPDCGQTRQNECHKRDRTQSHQSTLEHAKTALEDDKTDNDVYSQIASGSKFVTDCVMKPLDLTT